MKQLGEVSKMTGSTVPEDESTEEGEEDNGRTQIRGGSVIKLKSLLIGDC